MPFRALLLAVLMFVWAASGAAGSVTGVSTAAHTCPKTFLHTAYKGKHKCLATGLRKQIYYDLVRYQDSHPRQDERAYYVIAKRYRIPVSATYKIAIEGARKNWPLPPLP